MCTCMYFMVNFMLSAVYDLIGDSDVLGVLE